MSDDTQFIKYSRSLLRIPSSHSVLSTMGMILLTMLAMVVLGGFCLVLVWLADEVWTLFKLIALVSSGQVKW